ncbi:MAG: autotransporter domain-containing protein, partial [Burkholderiaceae bacterium]|nr:autotransporter domain-containing protein [Burkholderiaceae bacterium]
MFIPAQGMQRDQRHQTALRRLMALLGCGCCVSASLASPNAERVSESILSACGPSPSTSSIACSSSEPADFAPDKLVMQSVAALGAVGQQISLVNGRLDELRHANFGGPAPGFSGARGFSGAASAVPPNTSSVLAHTPLPVAAAAQRLTGSSPVGRAPSQTLLLASTSAALPDILVAQNKAQDSSPSAAQPATASAGGSTAFPSTDLGVYFRVEGDRGATDANTFDPGFRSRTAGLTVGADYKVSTNAVLGGALSYSDDRSTLDTSDGTPSGNVKTRGTGVSLYGAYYPTATSYVDATLVYGRNRYESVRSILVLTDSAIGSTSGTQYGASLGAGYSFLVSNVSFGPYARLSSSKVEIDAFTERVNNSRTHLAVQEQTAESVVSVLGAQISYV